MRWLYRALAGLFLSVTLLAQAAYADDGSAPGPDAAPPPPVQQIVISLSQQSLTATQDGAVVLQSPITSGGPYTPTPAGTYSIISHQRNWTMKSPWPEGDFRWYPNSWINYSMLWERSGYFIHDASWRNLYGPGSNLIQVPGTFIPGTHGCINVPLQAMIKLWNWAQNGAAVIVQR